MKMLDFGFYNMDCMQGMKNIESNSVDLCVTDPPYKIVSGGATGHKTFLSSVPIDVVKSGKLFKYNEIQFNEWIPEIYRILKDGSHCYLMTNGRNIKDIWIEAEKAGFKFQNILVWKKNNATPNKYYMNCIEFILVFRKGKAKTINEPGTKNLIEINNVVNKLHPTQKPVDLMSIFIINSSNKNEIIIDPFAGSGSTLVAAQKLKRRYIGYEIDKKYFDIARKRLDRTDTQMDIYDFL